jgi:hypothetical protein
MSRATVVAALLAETPAAVDWSPMTVEIRRTMGETRRLAQEVQQAKAQLQAIESAIGPLRTTITALERRLDRRVEPR